MRLYLSSFRNGNQPEELLKLLSGKTRTALIANAIDLDDKNTRSQKVSEEKERLSNIGLDVTEVDLRDYFKDNAQLKGVLESFDLVWVRGGNTFVLRRACKMSGADTILKELITTNAIVYGGYSAGIDLMVPHLKGANLVDDPNTVPNGYDQQIVWDGLGILPYSVAPHYKSDHPESSDIEKSVEYMIDNHIPFIALRDGEAIVIDDAGQRVVG